MSGSVAEAGAVTLSPTVTLFLVCIGQQRRKGPTRPRPLDPSGSGERLPGQRSEEACVADATSGEANPALLLTSRRGATTTRQRAPAGPTGTAGQSSRARGSGLAGRRVC